MGDDDRRSAYRAWVREHHPDRGGDPAVFRAGLQSWRRLLAPDRPAAPVTFHRRRRWTPLTWWRDRQAARRRPPRVR